MRRLFTLVELLTVMIIIMIISAMTLPVILDQTSEQGTSILREALSLTRSYAVDNQVTTVLAVYNYDNNNVTTMRMFVGEYKNFRQKNLLSDPNDYPVLVRQTRAELPSGVIAFKKFYDQESGDQNYNVPFFSRYLYYTVGSERYSPSDSNPGGISYSERRSRDEALRIDLLGDNTSMENFYIFEYHPNGTMMKQSNLDGGGVWGTIKVKGVGTNVYLGTTGSYTGLRVNKITNKIEALDPAKL